MLGLGLPEPADPAAIDMRRRQLSEAQREVREAIACVETLQQARERAHGESLAAWQVVEVAERLLAETRKYCRQRLAEAYVNREAPAGPSLAEAQAALEAAIRQREHNREVEAAVHDEITIVETDLRERYYQRDRAMAALVSVSPELLALYQRQAKLWIEMRSLRITMRAISSALGGGGLPQLLLDLAQTAEPIDDRRTGYAVDEGLISTWVAAVARLRDDAEAPLPGSGTTLDCSNGTARCLLAAPPPAMPVRGGQRLARQRATTRGHSTRPGEAGGQMRFFFPPRRARPRA